MKVWFSSDLLACNLTELKNQIEVNVGSQAVEWNVTSIHKDIMTILLYFNNPVEISPL